MDKIIKKILKNPLAIKRVNLELYADEIPKELALCENLEVLDISYSDITHIPKFVSKLPKLKSLQMLGCKRLKFPENLKEYPSLKELGIYSKRAKN